MMSRKYGFLRQLTRELSEEQNSVMVAALLAEGMEVYGYTETEKYQLIDASSQVPDGALYVTTADMEAARELLERLGYEEALCIVQPDVEPEDEVHAATQAYLRRRKSMYIQWGIIILVFIMYMIVKIVKN